MDRKKDYFDFRELRTQNLSDLQAVDSGQFEVGNQDFWRHRAGQAERFLPGARFTDDPKSSAAVHERTNEIPNFGMPVYNQHSHPPPKGG
jgi:hypothetical protein